MVIDFSKDCIYLFPCLFMLHWGWFDFQTELRSFRKNVALHVSSATHFHFQDLTHGNSKYKVPKLTQLKQKWLIQLAKSFVALFFIIENPKNINSQIVQKCVCVFYKKKNCALFCPCRLYNREKCTCNWEEKDILANGVSNFCTRRKRYFGKWSNIIDFSNAISIPVWTLLRRAQLWPT